MISERRSEEEDITFRRLWGSDMVKGGTKVLSGPQLGIAVPLVCVQLVSLLAGPTSPPLHTWLWDYRSNAFLKGQFPHTRPEELISNFPVSSPLSSWANVSFGPGYYCTSELYPPPSFTDLCSNTPPTFGKELTSMLNLWFPKYFYWFCFLYRI